MIKIDGYLYELETKEEILEAFAEFEKEISSFSEAFSDEEFVENYAKKMHENGRVVCEIFENRYRGIIAGYTNDFENKQSFVSLLAVKSDLGLAAGKVIGRLLRFSVNESDRLGLEKIVIEVDEGNVHARKLYEKLKFTYTGVKRGKNLEMACLAREVAI